MSMKRRLQGISLLAVALALPLAMGACPSELDIDLIVNPNPAPADQVADPVFSPAGGSFQDSLDVTVSCATPGATIHYTLDSTVPSASNGRIYNGPIHLTETTTVRAVAFRDSLEPSDMVTAIYTRSAGKSLSIADATVACTLMQGQPGSIDIHCMVIATLCQVQSVTVDLSAVGGDAAQPLTRFGNYWSWFGTVTPATAGTRIITFTAAATDGVTASASVTTVVANASPSISEATAVGELVCYRTGMVTVSCVAADSDGTIQSVQADLSEIGGASAQALSLSGGTWSWTGPVTPGTSGLRLIRFTAVDDQGASGTGSATIIVAAPNADPSIGSVSVPAFLVCGEPNTVSLSCTATDSDGVVQSVTADLSAIGGAAGQHLTQSGNVWQWSGSVSPTAAGSQMITITATDNRGASTTTSRTIQVVLPPTISDPLASGSLSEGSKGTVTVSCVASDSDGTVASVTANLLAIGGSALQTLWISGDCYVWTGEVTPPNRGNWTITFTATDAQGVTASTTATIRVAAPNDAPTVSNASASGELVLNQTCTVTVTCDAADADGTIQYVTANLSAIGGPPALPLALIDGHWTWTGLVVPTLAGERTVTFTATDNVGGTGSGSANVTVLGSQPGSLAGTFAGDVTYNWALVLSGTSYPKAPFVRASTVTFSADFQPASLPIFFGSGGPLVVSLPTDGLQNPGDQSTVSMASGSITGTVVQVSRSATGFRIDLNLEIVLTSGTLTGTYQWEGTLVSDNEISWSETTLLDVGASGICISVTSAWTLERR